MKRYLLLLFFISFSLQAQDHHIFAGSDGRAIQLKWFSKKLDPDAGYEIWRREGTGTWQQLGSVKPSPVIAKSQLATAQNPFPKDSAYAVYIDYKTSKETEANKHAYVQYSMAMASAADNAFAKHFGNFYDDASAQKGKRYQYRLMQGAKELAVSTEIAIGDKMPAPSTLKGTQHAQDVLLDWTPQDDFLGYNLYRDGSRLNADPIFANRDDKTYTAVFADREVTPGTHRYSVNGISYLMQESEASVAVSVTVVDRTAPASVTELKATRSAKTVKLEWKAPSDKDLKGYNILRSADRKKFDKINTQTVTATAFEVADAASGTQQYIVESVDAAGNATRSIPTSVFVPDHDAPQMPQAFKQETVSGKITLSWRANSEKDLAGYRIYRGLQDDDENGMQLLNVTPQTATTFIDTFPKKASTKLLYKVTALDKSFNESAKATAWVQLPDVVPPAAPILQPATVKDGAVILEWSAVTHDAIKGYEVYRIAGDIKEKRTVSLANGMRFEDRDAKKGMFEYYVVAVDSAGLSSPQSNKVHINTGVAEAGDVRLLLTQDVATHKVMVDIAGIDFAWVQQVRLFRKDGASGFNIVPLVFAGQPVQDATSEAGHLYEYFVEVIDRGDQVFRSSVQPFNNP